MRRNLRAVRRPDESPSVATCDEHLAEAMRYITPEVNGDDNDTHVVVRRLSDTHHVECAAHGAQHRAAWVLMPLAVLR